MIIKSYNCDNYDNVKIIETMQGKNINRFRKTVKNSKKPKKPDIVTRAIDWSWGNTNTKKIKEIEYRKEELSALKGRLDNTQYFDPNKFARDQDYISDLKARSEKIDKLDPDEVDLNTLKYLDTKGVFTKKDLNQFRYIDFEDKKLVELDKVLEELKVDIDKHIKKLDRDIKYNKSAKIAKRVFLVSFVAASTIATIMTFNETLLANNCNNVCDCSGEGKTCMQSKNGVINAINKDEKKCL